MNSVRKFITFISAGSMCINSASANMYRSKTIVKQNSTLSEIAESYLGSIYNPDFDSVMSLYKKINKDILFDCRESLFRL